MGRTPWSARVPLDPFFTNGNSLMYLTGKPAKGPDADPGVRPHKRLLKRGSFSLPFRFCKSLCDFWPIREGVPQSVCGQDGCADLTKHVLHFPPPAPARHPIHIPRGKAFLQPRSCARRADWSTTSRVARPGNSLDLS